MASPRSVGADEAEEVLAVLQQHAVAHAVRAGHHGDEVAAMDVRKVLLVQSCLNGTRPCSIRPQVLMVRNTTTRTPISLPASKLNDMTASMTRQVTGECWGLVPHRVAMVGEHNI